MVVVAYLSLSVDTTGPTPPTGVRFTPLGYNTEALSNVQDVFESVCIRPALLEESHPVCVCVLGPASGIHHCVMRSALFG